MRVFLDFEASSLGRDSYPIEVGWVFEDGRGEAHLIRPAPGWSDWDPSAEAVHRIPRAQLQAEGDPHDAVARRMLASLAGHALYASAPSWDGKWLSTLLRGAGLPRHALRLSDSHAARAEAVRTALAPRLPPDRLDPLAAQILAEVAAIAAEAPARHRALADAERERGLWLEARRRAEAAAARLAAISAGP
jgi:hypothetical protein